MKSARSSSAPRAARRGRGLRVAAKLLAVLAGVASMSIGTSAEAQPRPPTAEPVTSHCPAAAPPKECAEDIAKAIEGKIAMASQWRDALGNGLKELPAGARADSKQQAEDAVKGAQEALAEIADKKRLDEIKSLAASGVDADQAKAKAEALYSEYLGFVAMWTNASDKIKAAGPAPAAGAGAAAPNALAAATELAAEVNETLEICAKQCLSPGAFCIDARSGVPFCEGLRGATYDLPDALRPGERIAVRVIGKEAEDEGKVKLALNFAASLESLFKPPPPPAALAKGPMALTVVEEQIVQVPDDTTIAFLRIVFTRTDGTLTAPVEYRALVDHGQYYLEAGILLPIVVDGSRRVVTTPIPSTGGERMYSIAEDWSVNPSIVLNVFPGGRRRGFVSSYQGCFWCAGFWGDFLGLQAGVDLDLGEPFDRIFMGVVLQPVAGLSINSGLALVEQEFLPPGYAVGMPVTAGETLTPQPHYMPRFYFGATLTLDIVNTVATATRAAQKLF
ncbi:hypothetical protein WMF37_30970 [Sorangium sp. So ce291]|uniref:hypothetical protein n=1 Tax=Sorangium sp. So ce291 TaxID=3133294 RepID=UPI003F626543